MRRLEFKAKAQLESDPLVRWCPKPGCATPMRGFTIERPVTLLGVLWLPACLYGVLFSAFVQIVTTKQIFMSEDGLRMFNWDEMLELASDIANAVLNSSAT
eukprot:SAG11_NODE_7495_length_1137_cov_1.123314_3_plen_100_part_01